MKDKAIIIFLLVVFSVTLSGIIARTLKKAPANAHETVKFASWGSKSEVDIIKPILAEFEKQNPDIKVDFMHIPQNYFQKIHLLFASNLAPDVIFLNNLYLPIYANAGLLESLEAQKFRSLAQKKPSLQASKPSKHPDDPSPFYKKAIETLSYNGKLYAVPRDVSNLVVYYNKDIFSKYGVPCPSKYWSFNDLLVLAQKLTKDTDIDGKTDIWGISFEEDLIFYLPYLLSEGGGVLSDDLKTSIIDTPESKKGLQFYSDLRNKYNVAPKKSQSASATMAQLFLQGKLAMQVSGRWLVPKYRQDANFKWNVVNFPNGDKGSIVPMDASGWAITKNSKHKAAAAKLIEYLSSKQSIEKFTQSGLIVPARIDVAQGEFISEGENSPPNNKVFLDAIKTSKKTPVSINYREIQDELKEKTNYLFNSGLKK